MSLDIVQLPQWQDNYAYLIADPATGEAAVIDAPEPGKIPEVLKERGWRLTAIFNTHHHPDHVGANRALLQMFPELRVTGHASDRQRIPGMTGPLEDGARVSLGRETGTVMFVPGHTSGHIAYLFGEDLFCGDTLFAGGCGRLFEGTARQMFDSLSRLRALPESTRVWCAHEYTQSNLQFAGTVEPGNPALRERIQAVAAAREAGHPTVPSTIGEEKRTNVFLRWDSPEIADYCRRSDPAAEDSSVNRFAIVRKAKDRF